VEVVGPLDADEGARGFQPLEEGSDAGLEVHQDVVDSGDHERRDIPER
jgi:hypothetical protein